MIIDFKSIKHDFYGQVEQPVLTLKTMHESIISTITAYSIKPVLRFNDVSEITFIVPAYDNGEKIPSYEDVVGDRLIEVEPFGDFVIVDPQIKNEGGIKEYKEIKAFSKEYVLNYKRLNIPSGTYNFYNAADNTNTIVGMICEVLPDWTFGDIDKDLIGKYRTFENKEDNLYSMMMNTLQEAYNCLFLFDTKYKKIHVKSANYSARKLPIYLSFDNLLKTVNVTELSDEVITVLSGYGSGDEVNIRTVNPNGTNKIYNLDYYIARGDLPEDLTDKWIMYRDSIELYQEIFSNLYILYKEKLATLTNTQGALSEAKMNLQSTEAALSAAKIVPAPIEPDASADEATKNNYLMQLKEYEENIQKCESAVNDAQSEVDRLTVYIEEILSPDVEAIKNNLKDVTNLCSLKSNFTEDELIILSQYFKEDSITEDTFVITEYSSTSASQTSNVIDGQSNAKVKITDTAIYATNVAQLFNMGTDGLYQSIYTDPNTGEEIYFSSNIEAFEGMELPSDIEQTIIQQANEAEKRLMYEFRSGKFELAYNVAETKDGVVNRSDYLVCGDVVNVDFTYNLDNILDNIDENTSDISKARGFLIIATLNNASINDVAYKTMNITLQGMLEKDVPQMGEDFLSFSINNAVVTCTGSATEYQKQNVIQELYDYTKDSLNKLAYPSYQFSVDSSNFIFAQEFESFKDALELGCRINLALSDDEDVVIQPILIELSLNYDNESDFSIVFSDKFHSTDSEFKLADLITESTRTSRTVTLNSSSYNAYKESNTTSELDAFMNSALDVAKNKIINSANQAVEWNSSGLFLRKYDSEGGYEPKQVGMISDTIAFTKDNWETTEIAIGAVNDANTGEGYGIVAPSIFGTLVAGKNLVIENVVLNDDGTSIAKQFRVDSSGASLHNSSFILTRDGDTVDSGGKILIDPKYGIAAGNSNLFKMDGIEPIPSFIGEDGKLIFETTSGGHNIVPINSQFYFDINTGNAYFGGTINAENIIAGTLNGQALAEGSITEDLFAKNAVKNTLTSDGGIGSAQIKEVGGFTVTNNALYINAENTDSLSSTASGLYLGTDGIRNYSQVKNQAGDIISYYYTTIANGIITTNKIIATDGLTVGIESTGNELDDPFKAYTSFGEGDVKIDAGNNLDMFAKTICMGSESCFLADIYADTINLNGSTLNAPNVYTNVVSNGSNVVIDEGGTLHRYMSSSKRYKENITSELDESLNPDNLYNVTVYQYKYKDGYFNETDIRRDVDHIGFIAEDMEAHYPIAVNYNSKGEPEDWADKYIIPAMLKLLQNQKKEIDELKAEIATIKEAI